MKNYKLRRCILLALASLFVSGLVLSKSARAADPLERIKNKIQANLDAGASVAEAVKAAADGNEDDCSEVDGCCEDMVTAAIEMGLDAQEVLASAINGGCDPLGVGNAAYNAGANLHDIYMAGGSTSGGSLGSWSSAPDVEQPTDRPASSFVPRDNDDIRFGFTDG